MALLIGLLHTLSVWKRLPMMVLLLDVKVLGQIRRIGLLDLCDMSFRKHIIFWKFYNYEQRKGYTKIQKEAEAHKEIKEMG